MELGDLITPEAVIPALKAKNKKQALQELSREGSRPDRAGHPRYLRNATATRASRIDGVGRGIAIPHGRLPR